MNLLDQVRSFFARSKRRTPATGLGHPQSLAQTLSVDRLQSILRAAEGGDPSDLFTIYRDIIVGHAHTQTELNKRKLCALTKALTFTPFDPDRAEDIRLAELADRYLGKHPQWLTPGLNHLLNGHLYPVAILERTWKPAPPNADGIRYVLGELVPVPYHLLTWETGHLEIYDADPVFGMRLATKSRPDLSRYVIHRGHLLCDIPDNWGGPLRAALFWWLFATMDRDWWVAFLERFGTPFTVAKYDPSDDSARRTLASALSAAKRLFGLVISNETEVEVMAVDSKSHGEAFEKMHNVANDELSKLILGQTMTTTAQAGGLGGAQAEVQNQVRGDIEAWDLTILSATVRDQLVAEFARINGLPGAAELAVATTSAAELGDKASFLTALAQSGLELTDEGLDSLSQESGYPLRRRAGGAPLQPGALQALTASPPSPHTAPPAATLDRVAVAAAPDLARAFRGNLAPVRRLILESASAEDLEARLQAFYGDWTPGRLAALTQDALTAYAANGAAAATR